MTRSEVIRDPFIAGEREKLLVLYRKARADNPAIARLLFRRIKMAQAQISADFDRLVFGS